jgi:Protein of unknown function (DUF1592)/Protein of unknown function (DUF1588)/Protein of unknown function (DUF1585)/Protein of unknown function (DUF1587)/Protein of unknown function (DUF1595)/Cytochrome C oxidase, cbb3-type, subunit III
VYGRFLKIAVFGGAVLAGAGCQPSREELIAENEATIKGYCLECHNSAEQVGNMSLEPLDLAKVGTKPEQWEHVVRKLRAGVMPPSGEPRPTKDAYVSLASWIEEEIDSTATPKLPAPGLHRMNRAEYGNAIRDLLALDVDPATFLPADDVSRGFDNQAGTLALSPALLEAYLSAAGKVTRLALGAIDTPSQTMYRVAEDATQNYHVEGLPFGTRGGLVFEHEFPTDAEYQIKVFSVNLGNMGNFRPFGEIRGEKLEILVDGERVALVDWDEALVARGFGGNKLRTIDVRVPVTAGPHKVGVTFLATNYAPGLDMNRAFERSTIETGGLPGFTFYPHVGSVRIDGPYEAKGPGDTPSRRAILTCEPANDAEARPCAERIIRTLARRAYRGTTTQEDIDTLLAFYDQGSALGGFESGIEMALERMLTEPKFIYRFEQPHPDLAEGTPFRISDLELASRLSFFLWSSIPDDELLTLAEQGKLRDSKVLEGQVQRMLVDPRSEALTKNFAGQWLNLRALDGHVPVAKLFPDFDDNLRQAFRRETELFFDSLVRDNRPVTELLSADYTFVNERLAKHYGIPGVYGSHFRRVTLGEEHDARRGLLGKGSLLAVSSQPIRTSPVIRGYWVLQNLLGTPPPPPPEDVPDLPEVDPEDAAHATMPTMREQMERHRADPACSGCHMLMDPIGFALEKFDAIGTWRTMDGDSPIDASSVMYDGTKIEGPADLRNFLLAYSEQFIRTATEKLLTYALGRGVEYYDMPVVRSIAREAAADGYQFDALITAVVKSDPFQMSTQGSAPAESSEVPEPTATAAALIKE